MAGESTVGALVGLMSGARSHWDSGAYRLGDPPHILGVALAGATLLGIAYRLWRARGVHGEFAAAWILGAVAIVLASATLLSPQYFAWVCRSRRSPSTSVT